MEGNFTAQIDVQTIAIVVASTVMLFYREKTKKNLFSKMISLLGMYLIFLQLLFVIKVNTSAIDPNDQPWWLNGAWCVVLYTFLTYTAVYIVDLMFYKELGKIANLMIKRCQPPNLDINLDDEEVTDIYTPAYTTKTVTCLFIMITFAKVLYVMMYVATIVTMLVVCDSNRC